MACGRRCAVAGPTVQRTGSRSFAIASASSVSRAVVVVRHAKRCSDTGIPDQANPNHADAVNDLGPERGRQEGGQDVRINVIVNQNPAINDAANDRYPHRTPPEEQTPKKTIDRATAIHRRA